jgi:hypothetical protein
MKQTHINRPFVGADLQKSEVQLQSLCELLNDVQNPDRRDEFRRLVKPWIDAGSLKNMLARDSDTWSELLEELGNAWKPCFTLEGSGATWATLPIPRTPELPRSPREWAIREFALLVTNPLRDNLRGPCRRCGNYFVPKRRNKLFCSEKCKNSASAKRSMTAQRKAEQEVRLRCAARFWPHWTERKQTNRSLWIADRVNGSHLRIRTKKGWKPVEVIITGKWVSRNAVKIQKMA